MFNFNPEQQIKKMTPHVDKLVSYFKTKGISFSPTDGELENVVFKYNDKETKIAYHCFYRFSGISRIRKDAGNKFELVEVTDDMFINTYIKSLVEYIFFGQEDE